MQELNASPLAKELQETLWKQFLLNAHRIFELLDNFANEVAIEDEFDKTFKDFVERLSEIVTFIDHAFSGCFHDCFCGQQLNEFSSQLKKTHIDVRLCRDSIWECRRTGGSFAKFAAAFSEAAIKLRDRKQAFQAALDNVIVTLEYAASLDGCSSNGDNGDV